MKTLRGSIDDQAARLAEQPDAVKRIFDLSASNISQPQIPSMINEEFDGISISQEAVRRTLHRKPPCEFSDVEIHEGTLNIVRSRFKSYSQRRKKVVERKAGSCPKADTVILNEVLEARLVFQKALNKAIDAGMKEESVIAWCDVVARGDLR
jgi:hypothetical protein